MIGIDINEVSRYILEDERKKENPTVFLIGNISNREKSRLFIGAISGKGDINFDKIKDNAVDIVKAGLKGILALKDKTGVSKDVSVIDETVVDLIPFEYLVELLGAIVNHNFTTKDEEKN